MSDPVRAYLAEVEARVNAATPGPWDWYNDDSVLLSGELGDETYPHVLGGEGALYLEKGDADFIANSRTDVPRLVQMLRRCVEAMEQARRESAS